MPASRVLRVEMWDWRDDSAVRARSRTSAGRGNVSERAFVDHETMVKSRRAQQRKAPSRQIQASP